MRPRDCGKLGAALAAERPLDLLAFAVRGRDDFDFLRRGAEHKHSGMRGNRSGRASRLQCAALGRESACVGHGVREAA